MSPHPLTEAAARGEPPPWARMGARRREHVRRVAALLDDWARTRGVDESVRRRWQAAAWLHDSLKDAPEEELRVALEEGGPLPGLSHLAGLPGPVLHGPAAAARLREEGVDDEELLRAVAYHTLGHPKLGETGTMLYMADFLEPGRRLRRTWRASLRERMPHDAERVLEEVLRARIEYLLREGRPVRPETLAFWNTVAGEESWVRASEV